MKKKNSYLILSGKSWNSSLSERLKKQFPDCQWHHIKKKEDFIKSKVDKLSPEKIFIPHWSYIIKEEIYNNYECIVFHMTETAGQMTLCLCVVIRPYPYVHMSIM